MHAGFAHMNDPTDAGGAVYLRLSTRALPQIARDLHNDAELRDAVVQVALPPSTPLTTVSSSPHHTLRSPQGGYWHVRPTASTRVVIAFAGVVAPEALAAQRQLGDAQCALLQARDAP